jgi:hypothetical protein
MIQVLGRELNLTWEIVPTWYGWKWAMRPVVAWINRKREPSRFAILVDGGDS